MMTKSKIAALAMFLLAVEALVCLGAPASSEQQAVRHLLQTLGNDVTMMENVANGNAPPARNLKPPGTSANRAMIESTINSFRDRVKNLEALVGQNSDEGKRLVQIEERLEQITKGFDDRNRGSSDQLDDLLASFRAVDSRITAIEVVVQSLAEKAEHEQLELDCVKDIYNQLYAEAERKLARIGNEKIPGIIKKAYNHQIGNFDGILRFGISIQNIERSFNVLKALANEMRTNNHKFPFQLIQLCKSLNTEVIEQRNTRVIMKSEATKITVELKGEIKAAATGAVKNSWRAGNIEGTRTLLDEIFKLDELIWMRVMHTTINDLYSWNGLVNLIEYASKENDIERRVRNYDFILDVMSRSNDLNHESTFTLARKVKKEVDGTEHSTSRSSTKALIQEMKAKFPTSVASAVFSPIVCIVNVLHEEHLYAVMNPDYFKDKQRRTVFTWKDKVPVTNGIWRFEFENDDKFLLRSARFNEVLYADGDDYRKSGNRHIFTWMAGRRDFDAKWTAEIEGPYLRFKNTYRNGEYLFASQDEYNWERRYVYTGSKSWDHDSKGTYGDPRLWLVLPCQSSF